jgi:choline dehydrogenase
MVAAMPAGGWDDIVVGAGSSGAVLASRLSERRGRRVLLLEAGPARAAVPPAPGPLASPLVDGLNWDYRAYIGAEGSARDFPYRVGKVIGGSSAVNSAIALRGLPADFDGWAAAGNPEWSWDRVLPYFRRIEADADFGGPAHGDAGPVPIRRRAPGDYDAAAVAFVRACRDLGLPEVADLNGSLDAGVGPVPANVVAGRRMSVAEVYLAGALARRNLELRADCQVVRVLLAGRTVAGVEVLSGRQRMTATAARVTLCAGAVGSPVILQRSGIGPAGPLTAAGVRPLVVLPGVGENLADHPLMAIWSVLSARDSTASTAGHTVMARVSAQGGPPDLALLLGSNIGVPDMPGIGRILGRRTSLAVSAMLLNPASRGRVRIRDSAPGAAPAIALSLVSARADLDRLMSGTRLAWSLVRSAPMAAILQRPLVWTDRLIRDEALLREALPKFVSPMWHPAGTARMGPPGDHMAVVDQYGRVRGLAGLRVADASVMPSLPSATPNLTCIMIAERVAEWMDRSR